MRTDVPQTIYLKDYLPFPFEVEHINLTFKLFEDKTLVRSVMNLRQQSQGTEELRLNGEKLKLISLKIDGAEVDYTVTDKELIISDVPNSFELSIETEIDPASNTELEGLYKSQGTYCTQCEAQGFRKITYFPDRPDVLTTFTVRVEADKAKYPVLLSNGNLTDEGDLDDGRHYVSWNDPFKKPCYLFALVAGDLVHIQDEFETMSGRKVDLRIYVRAGDEGQCDYAMTSLIKSMKWDEEVYGREYELERFNIVAVSDFNMGAMENTSLNIFNTALVLAQHETATDMDFMRVESVIAHEYFHNWTGNRVTCRDWFQLSLKEGLTVFRDQEFSADMNSRAVQRIDDVNHLRRSQFPEDASPLAHPVRPDNYIEINNFYTMTVYEKGAEVIRMQNTLLGPDKYREATDLYFERYDGMAVTCEDFVGCMADASGLDKDMFFRWYENAGTPKVTAKTNYDAGSKEFTLTLSQEIPDTPGQTSKPPLLIPVAVGLMNPNGDDIDLGKGETTRILELSDKEQKFTFENIASKPVPSILRNFSAPVILKTDLTEDDFRFMQIHDSDGFNRWEAGQTLALRAIEAVMEQEDANIDNFINDYGVLLEQGLSQDTDKALLARALTLPAVSIIGQAQEVINPEDINTARNSILKRIKRDHRKLLDRLYKELGPQGEFSIAADEIARRSLRNTVLSLLTATNGTGCAKLAHSHYFEADNMTDRVAAVSAIIDNSNSERDEVIADFYDRFKDYQLVIDKWFSLQTMSERDGLFDDLSTLRSHKDFTMKNPNRVRSLYAAFAMNNPVKFHDASGKGYKFLTDGIIELNEINPQIAARLVTPLREWRRYTQDRQKLMKESLERIASTPNLSDNVFEIVSKSLK